jgi:hypothetical protein
MLDGCPMSEDDARRELERYWRPAVDPPITVRDIQREIRLWTHYCLRCGYNTTHATEQHGGKAHRRAYPW